jgi:hypothetical protein
MKINLIKILILISVIFIAGCYSGENRVLDKVEVISYDSLKIEKNTYNNLEDCGKIAKTVKLETIEDSLIGSVDRIIIDPQTEDILILDYRSRKKVLRFNSQGKFLRSYGKHGQGPGEYNEIENFTINSNGDVIILSSTKLIKFSREGHYLTEIRTHFYAKYIECIDDNLYIPVLRYSRSPKVKKDILIFNSLLVNTGGIGEYDLRLTKDLYLVKNSIIKSGKKLLFIDLYKFNLKIYDTITKKLSILKIPNQNSDFENMWKKKRLTFEEGEEISTKLHRFSNILNGGTYIILFEQCHQKEIYNTWLLNLEKKEIKIFNSNVFYSTKSSTNSKHQKKWAFHRISGSFDGGVIGVLNDPESFNRFKNSHPLLERIEFKIDDNPILVFFHLKI